MEEDLLQAFDDLLGYSPSFIMPNPYDHTDAQLDEQTWREKLKAFREKLARWQERWDDACQLAMERAERME
jgi:hypothetical protein